MTMTASATAGSPQQGPPPNKGSGGGGDDRPGTVAPADPTAVVQEQLANIHPITTQCSTQDATKWLTQVGEVFYRIATGGLPSLPSNAITTIHTLASQVISHKPFITDSQVLTKVLDMVPSIWTMGYWYSPLATWKPLMSSVFEPVAEICKADPRAGPATAYDALINATSLMIRFTKDNVFMDGVDDGRPISSVYGQYLELLPQFVTCAAKTSAFKLTTAQLRTYMNSIPSKKDGMNMSAPYPVYVDTSKYRATDAAALKAFLSNGPNSSPVQH